MAPQTLLVVFLCAVLAVTSDQETGTYEFPWAVAFMENGHMKCGGTIISKDWVLTAGNCVYKYGFWSQPLNPDRLFLYISEISLLAGSHMERYQIEKVVLGPRHHYGSFSNDICLLKTSRPMDLDGVRVAAAKLPPPGFPVPWTVKVSMWNWTDSTQGRVASLKVAEHIVLDFEQCNAAYPNYYPEESSFCGLPEEAKRCQDDMGGSASVGDVVVGVVATPRSCDTEPTYYATVSSVMDWINNVTGIPTPTEM